jgi:dehydrogenase/reductase SDR family protein 1
MEGTGRRDGGQGLSGKVALVTGASRGIGKGIAVALGEAGATVYLTGRSTRESGATVPIGGLLEDTAEKVTAAGGRGIALRCDHRDDAQVRSVVERIHTEGGRLDLLVNNVWGGYEIGHRGGYGLWMLPFWEQPLDRWDDMFASGVRAHYVTSALAVPLMLATGPGLIVNISFGVGGEHAGNVAYGVAKTASDRFTADAAKELSPHGITVVALHPGMVRTEGVLAWASPEELVGSESPLRVGRIVVALAQDGQVARYSGRAVSTGSLAEEFGVEDTD